MFDIFGQDPASGLKVQGGDDQNKEVREREMRQAVGEGDDGRGSEVGPEKGMS